ncbi:uncharacterized protein CMC5_043920 [Chondromyces crocatus]|uniref:Uncharacterized protein n=1 Tax=Chondromyces crocatus TaxID=52 RepID=A0A0K1EHB0_CHOCO|nr:uncharacterized protein CMC5_043920 [Chondromyces crocatus]
MTGAGTIACSPPADTPRALDRNDVSLRAHPGPRRTPRAAKRASSGILQRATRHTLGHPLGPATAHERVRRESREHVRENPPLNATIKRRKCRNERDHGWPRRMKFHSWARRGAEDDPRIRQRRSGHIGARRRAREPCPPGDGCGGARGVTHLVRMRAGRRVPGSVFVVDARSRGPSRHRWARRGHCGATGATSACPLVVIVETQPRRVVTLPRARRTERGHSPLHWTRSALPGPRSVPNAATAHHLSGTPGANLSAS